MRSAFDVAGTEVGSAAKRGLDELSDLEAHVSASQTFVLLHGSMRQLTPANWLQSRLLGKLQVRELDHAGQSKLPIVRLYESEPKAMGPPPFGEVEEASDLLSPWAAILDGEPVAWASSPDFQLPVLAQLAEVMLLASPAYCHKAAMPLYVEGGVAWQQPSFADSVRVYISPNNPSGNAVAELLCEAMPELKVVHVRNNGRRAGVKWMLYLTPTVFDGDEGERLAFECETALKAGLQPLLVYSPDECTFGEIVDAMPKGMLSAGLYGPRTVEWRNHDLRSVSIRLIAKALGANMQADSGVATAKGCRGRCALLLWTQATRFEGGLARFDDTQSRMLMQSNVSRPSRASRVEQLGRRSRDSRVEQDAVGTIASSGVQLQDSTPRRPRVQIQDSANAHSGAQSGKY